MSASTPPASLPPQDSWDLLAQAPDGAASPVPDDVRLSEFWLSTATWTFRNIIKGMPPGDVAALEQAAPTHSGRIWEKAHYRKYTSEKESTEIHVRDLLSAEFPEMFHESSRAVPDAGDPDGLPPLLRAALDVTASWTDPAAWRARGDARMAPLPRLVRNVAMFLMQRRPIAALDRWPNHPVWGFGLSSNGHALLENSGSGVYSTDWIVRLLEALPHQAILLGLTFTPDKPTPAHAVITDTIREPVPGGHHHQGAAPVDARALSRHLPAAPIAGRWSLDDPGRFVATVLSRPGAAGQLRLIQALPGLADDILRPANACLLLPLLAQNRHLKILSWLITSLPNLTVSDNVQEAVGSALVTLKPKSLRHVDWGALKDGYNLNGVSVTTSIDSRASRLLLDLWARWGVPTPEVLRRLMRQTKVRRADDPTLLNTIMVHHHPRSPGWDSVRDDSILVDLTRRYKLDPWLIQQAQDGWVPDDRAWSAAPPVEQASAPLRAAVEQAVLERVVESTAAGSLASGTPEAGSSTPAEVTGPAASVGAPPRVRRL
jgi:hypothetical protein